MKQKNTEPKAAAAYTLTAKQAADLDNQFSHHKPHGDQSERYVKIREAAKILARTILENSPVSADQNAALRKVREAVMTANASIAINEKEPEAAAA